MKMTKMEIATYVGMANILLGTACSELDREDTVYIDQIREALCQAQLMLTQQAIEEFWMVPPTEEQ